uniref:Uncharacterized protein n=1 Tax=Panagrolaimus davidi TaxID=227884 RepID=A0A914QLR4_9BILA
MAEKKNKNKAVKEASAEGPTTEEVMAEKKDKRSPEKTAKELSEKLDVIFPIGTKSEGKGKGAFRQNNEALLTMTFVREILMKAGKNSETQKHAFSIGLALFGCSISSESQQKQHAGITFNRVKKTVNIKESAGTYVLGEDEIKVIIDAFDEASATKNGILSRLKDLAASNGATHFSKTFVFVALHYGFLHWLIKSDVNDVPAMKERVSIIVKFGFGGLYCGYFSPAVINPLFREKKQIEMKGSILEWIPANYKPTVFNKKEIQNYPAAIKTAPFLYNSVEILSIPGGHATLRSVAMDMAQGQNYLIDFVLKKDENSFQLCKDHFDLLKHDDLHKAIRAYLEGQNLDHVDLLKKAVVNRWRLYDFVSGFLTSLNVAMEPVRAAKAEKDAQKAAGAKKPSDKKGGKNNSDDEGDEAPGPSEGDKKRGTGSKRVTAAHVEDESDVSSEEEEEPDVS